MGSTKNNSSFNFLQINYRNIGLVDGELETLEVIPNKKIDIAPTLSGNSIHRLLETLRMFLAMHEAGLPITIDNPEGIRKRLLAQDNVGVIPCFDSLHRANQRFRDDEDVFDVLHFDDFGRYKTRLIFAP